MIWAGQKELSQGCIGKLLWCHLIRISSIYPFILTSISPFLLSSISPFLLSSISPLLHFSCSPAQNLSCHQFLHFSCPHVLLSSCPIIGKFMILIEESSDWVIFHSRAVCGSQERPHEWGMSVTLSFAGFTIGHKLICHTSYIYSHVFLPLYF